MTFVEQRSPLLDLFCSETIPKSLESFSSWLRASTPTSDTVPLWLLVSLALELVSR